MGGSDYTNCPILKFYVKFSATRSIIKKKLDNMIIA